jgi:hypothetical protein
MTLTLTLTLILEKEDLEILVLREYKTRVESELVELRQAVDTTASYESMIESLTDVNLELSQRGSQLELTVRYQFESMKLLHVHLYSLGLGLGLGLGGISLNR